MSEGPAIDMDRLILKARIIAKQRHGIREEYIVAHQVRFEKFSSKYIVIELYTKYPIKVEVWFQLRESEDNVIVPTFETSIVKPMIECLCEAIQ